MTHACREPKIGRQLDAEVRREGKDAEVRIESLDELVDFFIAAGKKGSTSPRGWANEPGHAVGDHDGSDQADAAAGESRGSSAGGL
jgi:hypothetical protein